MTRLTASDARALNEIKSLCYGGLDAAVLREQTGDRIAAHLGAPSYCFGTLDPATALPTNSITVGLGPDSVAAYLRNFLATPSLDFGPWAARRRRVALVEEIVPNIEEDPYLTEILRPSGLRYDIQVSCSSGDRSWGHLCLRRAEEQEPFSAGDVRFLEALVPHLTAGLRAAAVSAALASSPGTTTGVVVLGRHGKIEMANGVASRLFSRPVEGNRHSFMTAVNIVAGLLERCLDADELAPPPVLTVIDEPSGETYRVRAERVTATDGEQRGLVLFEPAAPAAGESLESLQQIGLTRREAEVTQAVLRGNSTAKVAAELFISPHTVHDHLRKVFEKLGVNSRQQLAHRLLGG